MRILFYGCSDESEDRNLISYVINYVSEAASLPLRQSRLVAPPATTCIWIFFSPPPVHLVWVRTLEQMWSWLSSLCLPLEMLVVLYLSIYTSQNKQFSEHWINAVLSLAQSAAYVQQIHAGCAIFTCCPAFCSSPLTEVRSRLGTTFLPTLWASSKPPLSKRCAWTPQKPVQSVMSTIWRVASKTLELTTKN